jgi:hypothetical protein
MPRAKIPLAEADPNAPRLASNPKSAKTNAGRIKKTAAGLTLESDELEGSVARNRISTRKKSSDAPRRSPQPKSPSENNIERPSSYKSTRDPQSRTYLSRSAKSVYLPSDATNPPDEEHGIGFVRGPSTKMAKCDPWKSGI